ncbi:unnamed protein product [Callosobruchus maculatus]|uniref:Uncharacterized protein n=1 Tax=Callosobruchus maculatus TaxID=64391 RepID=A0A653DS00_CALMS|nr:unnamed protein product [Callosobruchus maculatus]
MSLMLKKKYEDSKKFPILDPATPEVMEKKSAVLRHRTTILPLILKSTKRAKVKEEHYSERDIDRMNMEDSDVKSIDEHVKYAQDPRMAKLASAYSERQSKTLDRKETMSSRGAALSRNMTTISVPVSRLKSSGKKVSKGVKSASSSSLRTSPSIQSDSVSKGAEDSESRKSFWSILNWTPFGYGAKQVNRVNPSISVNRVFKKDKVDTTVERDEERDEDSVKKAVLINTKSKEADGNVKKKGTVMSKKNKRKSRTKAKKLSPPPGVTTKIFLCSSDVDNIDRLYDKVRTASATRPMEPVEDKKYSTRPKLDINYLVTKDQSPTYKLVADLEKRKMKYILNRFKLVPKKLKHSSLKFVNKKSTGVVDKIVPESDNYSLFVGKARYKLAYV